MNIFSLPLQLYIPITIGIVLVSVCLLALLLLVDNETVLRGRLRSLRMNEMLQMRGLGQEEYLRLTPPAEVRRQLARCRHCAHTRQCDAAIMAGEVFGTGFSYCPNTPALDKILRKIHRAEMV
jgi:hypothetical protein